VLGYWRCRSDCYFLYLRLHQSSLQLLLQCALLTSVLILYLGWSSDCWLLGCCSNLTPLICPWRCVCDRLLWSALTLRLWSVPLICSGVASLIGSFDLLLHLWSTPLICSFGLCPCVSDLPSFYSSPPWNRVLAPRIEDTLSKGYFSSLGQVVMGITSVNIRCSDNSCSPSRCLGTATVRSLFVVAGKL
jgi:hypothetical protein